jgi:hypothetical protein
MKPAVLAMQPDRQLLVSGLGASHVVCCHAKESLLSLPAIEPRPLSEYRVYLGAVLLITRMDMDRGHRSEGTDLTKPSGVDKLCSRGRAKAMRQNKRTAAATEGVGGRMSAPVVSLTIGSLHRHSPCQTRRDETRHAVGQCSCCLAVCMKQFHAPHCRSIRRTAYCRMMRHER